MHLSASTVTIRWPAGRGPTGILGAGRLSHWLHRVGSSPFVRSIAPHIVLLTFRQNTPARCVLLLAGHGAGVAADASLEIDDHTVSHLCSSYALLTLTRGLR